MLKTDYKDDVLDGLRKYRMVNNSDGTVSFVDVTMYDQEGDDYGANDINSTNEAVNNIGANQATIENTTTASKAYAVGDFLVYDGVLYKVTQAISSGGTISIGTNVVADKVGDEIARINSDLTELLNWKFISCAKTTVTTSGVQVALSENLPENYNEYCVKFSWLEADITSVIKPKGVRTEVIFDPGNSPYQLQGSATLMHSDGVDKVSAWYTTKGSSVAQYAFYVTGIYYR